MNRPTRTSSANADWASHEEAAAPSSAAAERPHHTPLTNTRNTLNTTFLAFSYNDDEDFQFDTIHRSSSQPNLMKTSFTSTSPPTTKQPRGALTRVPSTGTLVSVEVLQELMSSAKGGMDRSTRSFVEDHSVRSTTSYGSGYRSKCSICSSNRSRRSFSSEGDAHEEEGEGGWKARVSQLKQFALIDGLFGGERETFKWNVFGGMNSASIKRDFVVQTKSLPELNVRPQRRSLPGSVCGDSESDLSCSGRLFDDSKEQHNSDGAVQKQPSIELEPTRQRRASDSPTSPTLSIRTAISDVEKMPVAPIKMERTEEKKSSSNNVCDVQKSPLATAAELQLAQTPATPSARDLQLQRAPSAASNLKHRPAPIISSSMKENQPNDAAVAGVMLRNQRSGEEESQSDDDASADLNKVLISLFNKQNAQKGRDNEDDDKHSDTILSIRSDFEKASRRKSFEKSLSESFRSGDFDHQLSSILSSEARSSHDKEGEVVCNQHDLSEPAENTEASQSGSGSFRKYKKRNSGRIGRRATVESETGKSAVSSLDSLASPIDRARVGHASAAMAAPSTRGHLSPSQFTNMAQEATPPLKQESDLGSMSSLGTESIDRDGIKAKEFLKRHSIEHSATVRRLQEPNFLKDDDGNKTTNEPDPPEKSGLMPGDQSSITMGTFFTEFQKTLTGENRNTAGVLDTSERSSRRRSGASSLTLGTFSSELQKLDEDSLKHEDDSDKDAANTLDDMCDFDSGLAHFVIAMRLGHFDCHDKIVGNINTDEDDDRYLAAKAFMGLGFAAQIKGENETALDCYMKSLQLWEAELGAEHVSLACLHYTIGMVLSQERNELESSVHFNNALSLLKSNKTADDETTRASILFTEGMIFIVLGEAERAIDCFKKAMILCQNFDLNHATIMYEMGNLLAQKGELDHAIKCFRHALSIRERIIGNSFLVMQIHYSLGVTLAEDDSPRSRECARTHLQQALALCGDSHIQAPTIIHAIGVLSEKKGDHHAAANWFYKELNAIKSLFGEDDERVGMCSVGVGSSFFQIGKFDIAINLFEQALRILLQATEDEQSLEVADLLYKIASCHESLCEYDEALGIFEEVKQIRVSQAGIESSPVIQTMLRIGNIQLSRGEAQLALDCFNEILGIGYANDTINGIEVANAFYGKGCSQFCLFQLPDAMKSLNESLNWKLAALGEDSPGLACIFYQMAHVYIKQSENDDAIICLEEYSRLLNLDNHMNLQDHAEVCHTAGIISKLKGQYDTALAFYNQALSMFQALFVNHQCHEKIATIHYDMGCIYVSQGDNKEALRQFHLCLEMRKQMFGSPHIDVATVLYEMASILQKENMTKPAIMCLEESDSIWQAKLGCSEKLVSICYESGKLWKSLLRYSEAERQFEKALEFAITLHGQTHVLVATILFDLGELLHEIKEYDQALFFYDESLGAFTNLFGPEDLKVANVFYCKGVALLFQSRFEEALDCLMSALRIREEKLGDIHNDVADTLNTIGFLQLRQGNIASESALVPLTKALKIRRSLDNKAKVVSTLQNLARLYKKREEFDLCVEMHNEILTIQQEEFGMNDEKVAEAWMNLGNIQTTTGRFVEATVSYEEALRIRTLINGYNDSSVAQVLFKLGLLSSRQNNYPQAKQLFEEYIRLRGEEENESADQEMAQALTLIGDIQSDTGEKSKAQINWLSAMEIYLSLGYEEDHPKVAKLKSRQKVPTTWSSRLGAVNSRDISDWSSVVDAPLSLFNRLASINSRSTTSLAPKVKD